jgi:hypothetical protein
MEGKSYPFSCEDDVYSYMFWNGIRDDLSKVLRTKIKYLHGYARGSKGFLLIG